MKKATASIHKNKTDVYGYKVQDKRWFFDMASSHRCQDHFVMSLEAEEAEASTDDHSEPTYTEFQENPWRKETSFNTVNH